MLTIVDNNYNTLQKSTTNNTHENNIKKIPINFNQTCEQDDCTKTRNYQQQHGIYNTRSNDIDANNTS